LYDYIHTAGKGAAHSSKSIQHGGDNFFSEGPIDWAIWIIRAIKIDQYIFGGLDMGQGVVESRVSSSQALYAGDSATGDGIRDIGLRFGFFKIYGFIWT